MHKELTGIKDWSRGDLETFSQEAYDMLRWIRERLDINDYDEIHCENVSESILDFLTEWEMPLEDD